MNPIFTFIISFFLGSIPTAYLAGKSLKNIDIRQHGSGNVGATNAFRVLGKKIGTAVFVLDFFKGFLPSLVFSKIAYSGNREMGLWIGVAAILGHIFSPFLKFKGGKGIATGGGVLCAMYPELFVLTFMIWVSVYFLTRIVSISSLMAMGSLVAMSWLFKLPTSTTILYFIIFIIFIWTHRSNISRLLCGKENKVVNKKNT